MDGTRVVQLHDRQVKLEVEVYRINDWYFSRYRYETLKWKNSPKPYRNTLSAIRGAYYAGTGLI